MTIAIIFGDGDTQFAPVPDDKNDKHTVRVTGINADGARITTASSNLDSVDAMRETLFSLSVTPEKAITITSPAELRAAREAWHREREAAQARIAEMLVAFHRPTRADAAQNVLSWLALLEAVTQTPVEKLVRAEYAFEVRVAPVLEIVVEKGTIRLGGHSAAAPSTTTLDDALALAANALGTNVESLCATYALKRIAHRAGEEGEIIECVDSPNLLRGKKRRAIELHEHERCATCQRAIRKTSERTAAPPRLFFPRLIVCNLCPVGQEFALWNGMRIEYDVHNSLLRMSTRVGPFKFAAQETSVRGERNVVRAAREVMVALLLAIQRESLAKQLNELNELNELNDKHAQVTTPLVTIVRGVPTPLLRLGFEKVIRPL